MTAYCGWRWWLRSQRKGGAPRLHRVTSISLLGVALLSGLVYFYGSRNNGVWLQRWDLFHTVLNVRYFDELGYDDLYTCSFVFDRAEQRRLGKVATMRDSASGKVLKTAEVTKDNTCEQAFSNERKLSFLKDLNFFLDLSGKRHRKDIFQDKGFNGTPFHVALIAPLLGSAPLSMSWLYALACLDIVLLAAAFFAAYRAFGSEISLLAFIFFCVNFPNQFIHMGGSILRFDYVAAMIAAVSALKLQRPGTAGVFIAYATLTRVFPVLFAAAFLLKIAWDFGTDRRVNAEALRFLLGFAIAGALFFLVSLWPGGLAAWRDWAHDILVHTKQSAGFRVGIKNLFMLQGNMLSDEEFIGYSKKARIFSKFKPLFYLLAAILLAPALRLIRRLDNAAFAIYFFLATFCVLLISTRYYYAVLVLGCLFLLPRTKATAETGSPSSLEPFWALLTPLFAISAITYAVSHVNSYSPFLYNAVFSSLMLFYVVYVSCALWLTTRARSGDPA